MNLTLRDQQICIQGICKRQTNHSTPRWLNPMWKAQIEEIERGNATHQSLLWKECSSFNDIHKANQVLNRKNSHFLLQQKQRHILKGLKRSTEQNNWVWMAMPSWHVVRWRGAYFGNDIKSLYLVATKQREEHWHRKNIPDVIFLRLKRKKIQIRFSLFLKPVA